MENPYKQARLDKNWTQREAARHAEVTPQTVLMLEQGLFNSPPEKLRLTFPVVNPAHYERWRLISRNESTWSRDANLNSETWQQFRESVVPSFKGFCVKLYFQPSILREFEQKWFSRDLVVLALSESNVPYSFAKRITERRRVRRVHPLYPHKTEHQVAP